MTAFATIYKKTKGGKTQEWTVEVDADKYRTISGQTDGKKVTSEWTVCTPKNVGRANATTGEEQAIVEAQALRKKKLEHGYFEDVANIEQKQYFEPMLARDYNDFKDEIKFPIYSQPKLDGVRCIVTKDGMFSRNGKEIISAPHIYSSLKPYFDREPNLIFDGELYCDKLANDFNKIISLVRKTKPTEADLKESADTIQYWIYDLPSTKDLFQRRFGDLITLHYKTDILWPECCRLVTTDVIVDKVALEKMYGVYMEAGFEGQMLRVINKPYENKRSNFLLKHKTFTDEEFTILDIGEGIGNRAGTAGYMTFERNGKRFNSNIKGNFEYVVDILKNRDSLIGKKATVKYFNITPDGVPRFPYVINIDRASYEG
jgi:DNA ligase-1